MLESIFQDPCPTLNGTRRVTMPQVLTRRREPIHPSSQARSPAPTNPKTGSGSDHPGGRSPQSLLNLTLTLSGYSCTLSNCTHRLVSHLTLTGYSCMPAEQPHPPPRLSSHSHRVQLHAEQPHPPPRLILCQSSSLLTHRFSAGWPPPLFLHSSPRPKALRSRSSTVASTPRPSRSSASSTR